MPIRDITVTLSVAEDDGQGKPIRTMQIRYRIPANSAAGLALADPGKLKIGTAIEQLGDLLDRDHTDL
jgi:hypothetical protein